MSAEPPIDSRLKIAIKNIELQMREDMCELLKMEIREEKGENMCGEGWEKMDNLSGRIHAYAACLDVLKEVVPDE